MYNDNNTNNNNTNSNNNTNTLTRRLKYGLITAVAPMCSTACSSTTASLMHEVPQSTPGPQCTCVSTSLPNSGPAL